MIILEQLFLRYRRHTKCSKRSLSKTKKSGDPIGFPGNRGFTGELNGQSKAHAHLTAHVTTHHAVEARLTHARFSFDRFTYLFDMFLPQGLCFVKPHFEKSNHPTALATMESRPSDEAGRLRLHRHRTGARFKNEGFYLR